MPAPPATPHDAAHTEPDDGAGPVLSAMLWTMAPPGGTPAPDDADPAAAPRPDPKTLRAAISENEWARVASFRDPSHAWSSAATRALLRAMLSRYHGADPMAWHFLTEPGGRPHVDMSRLPQPMTAETRPRFSLSHTRGLAACMVSLGPWPTDAHVGVDVEYTHRTLPAGRLAARFFHPDEAAALATLERGPPREQYFLSLWTRKESVLKALGMGIANHLALYACLGDPPDVVGPAAVVGPADMTGAPADWRMSTGDPTAAHRLSWAVYWPGSPNPHRPWRAKVTWRHLSAWPP
ncbi:4'-phosphopantetheinyl transferase family protein [Roseospira marina]|nr:4'-phosphopantetheinyl transferase superfamily protein [Roseospira marina]MBB4313787.1 4'-phosphopantetheinyl transferase [Roseospira marina]MBB5086949.1 4'-phosphopantetheinyl transferase [Roseospira marina]